MAFEVDELTFRNSELRLNQFFSPPQSKPDTTSTKSPFVAWDNILLENITLHYESRADNMVASALLGRLNISESELALNEQSIQVADIEFTQSDINLMLPPPSASIATTDTMVDTAKLLPLNGLNGSSL
ncbi:MAG: hypothetical protein U5L96_20300 [Owenweeksia sp.]|nr:hypothetical protein [Owenweeksia sp.]